MDKEREIILQTCARCLFGLLRVFCLIVQDHSSIIYVSGVGWGFLFSVIESTILECISFRSKAPKPNQMTDGTDNYDPNGRPHIWFGWKHSPVLGFSGAYLLWCVVISFLACRRIVCVVWIVFLLYFLFASGRCGVVSLVLRECVDAVKKANYNC